MDNCLDRCQVPKLNQDQINHVNPKEIEVVIKSLSNNNNKKAHVQMGFYLTFKEDLIPILFNLFHKTETEGTLPNLFYEATIMLIAKPQKNSTNRTSDQLLL